jgi:hypothetical protein
VDVIKTWPAFMQPRKVLRIFSYIEAPFATYYFSLGRGRPKVQPDGIWFTYRGRILGCLPIIAIVRNDGSLPKLHRLDGEESEWQFKHDVWVAIADPPIERVREHLYYPGFRGWRYFDFESYRRRPEARIKL